MLDFSISFFITIFNLAVLYLVLRKFLFGKIKKFMNDRAERVRKQIDEAAAVRKGADLLKAQYEALLANSENEAEWVVKEAEERAKVEYAKKIAQAEEEARQIRKQAEEWAASEKRRARDELAREIANLAVAAAGNVLGRNVQQQDDVAEAERFVRAVGSNHG